MASLELTSIAKKYGAVEVMRGLNLSVKDGAFCALLGPSGCGKSTLLRMIAGLETVTDGKIKIGATDVTNEEPSKRGVAMVFQNYTLYPHLTVRQNIGFSLSLAGAPKAEQLAKTDPRGKASATGTPDGPTPGRAFGWPAPACRHRAGTGARPQGVPV